MDNVVVPTCEIMQANSQLGRNEESSNHLNDKANARANAIERLRRLRMKRKAQNDHHNLTTSVRRTRTTNVVPIPPTQPARRVNASTMQFLFEKRLQLSDVKEDGRIVIPKAFAEKHMPALESKEGFYIFMDDMVAARNWMFRYRYWPNNSSRIYVLENTGEFIRAYGLQIGDFIMVYKDMNSQDFAIGTRKSHEDSLSMSRYKLQAPNWVESGSSSSYSPSRGAGASAAASSSEYAGGLIDFPFNLLEVDISDLPEY